MLELKDLQTIVKECPKDNPNKEKLDEVMLVVSAVMTEVKEDLNDGKVLEREEGVCFDSRFVTPYSIKSDTQDMADHLRKFDSIKAYLGKELSNDEFAEQLLEFVDRKRGVLLESYKYGKRLCDIMNQHVTEPYLRKEE